MIRTETSRIQTDRVEILLDEDGILITRVLPGVELKLKDVEECFAAYRKMGCKDRKVLQLMEVRSDFNIDAEGRRYAAMHGKDYFIASAIISRHMAVRLLVNFFNSFYTHGVPFKLFATAEEARAWLLSFRRY